jgi:hypothetical protein
VVPLRGEVVQLRDALTRLTMNEIWEPAPRVGSPLRAIVKRVGVGPHAAVREENPPEGSVPNYARS